MWPMSNHKSVANTRGVKIKIPTEIFLTWFFISFHAQFAKFANYPVRHVISETTGINEIVHWFGHVKGRAFKSDDRPDV